MLTIKETMPSLMTDGGIFKYINPTNDRFGTITATQLGIAYWSKSGCRTVNSLISNYLVNGLLSEENTAMIGYLLNQLYGLNWDKRWESINAEYNALENYNKIITSSDKKTGTDTYKYGPITETSTDEVQAFNSSSFQPSDKNSRTKSDATNTTDYGNESNYIETTSGNIGVTTSQQMLEAELKIRTYDFFSSIFKDINDFLTLQIYSPNASESTDVLSRLILAQTENGATISYGEQKVVIRNGEDGQDGGIGKDGKNGLTPILNVEEDGDLFVEYEEV